MKVNTYRVTGYILGTLYYGFAYPPNRTDFVREVNGTVGGLTFEWTYSPDGTPYGVGRLQTGSTIVTIPTNIATLPNFEQYWVTEAEITNIELIGSTCSDDSCRVDCPTSPDGFCCLPHSFLGSLHQVLNQ